MRANYWGFVPIIILMGADVGFGGLGPPNIPPAVAQSATGHSCLSVARPTELNDLTKASQAGPTCPSGLQMTMIPITEPMPVHTHVCTSQFACFRMTLTTPPRPLG